MFSTLQPYTNYRGFVFHRYKVVLLLVQLRGPRSGRVRPWRSGDCKSSFPDTFEPERIRTTQCEGVQLWHQSPPKWCVRRHSVTIIHLAAACAPELHAARMPGVVISAGITPGRLPFTRQQHSSARSASVPSLDTMVMTGAAGSSRGEGEGDLTELSSTNGWWYAA